MSFPLRCIFSYILLALPGVKIGDKEETTESNSVKLFKLYSINFCIALVLMVASFTIINDFNWRRISSSLIVVQCNTTSMPIIFHGPNLYGLIGNFIKNQQATLEYALVLLLSCYLNINLN